MRLTSAELIPSPYRGASLSFAAWNTVREHRALLPSHPGQGLPGRLQARHRRGPHSPPRGDDPRRRLHRQALRHPFGGQIAPDASAGTLQTQGSLEALQLGGGQVFWADPWLELATPIASAEANIQPSPPYPGKVGRVPIAALSLATAQVSADPKARTVAVTPPRWPSMPPWRPPSTRPSLRASRPSRPASRWARPASRRRGSRRS